MRKVLLAGLPNVGKSTVFNALTLENQHTGNWIGKTVETAKGEFTFHGVQYELLDLPGIYSLNTHSMEEEVARDVLAFESYDAIIVVCDAVSLERNLLLVLQILEITKKVVLCVNLMDEAKKKGISIDADLLSSKLGIEVVLTSARKKQGLEELLEKLEKTIDMENSEGIVLEYPSLIEEGLLLLEKEISNLSLPLSKRFLSVQLLTDEVFIKKVEEKYQVSIETPSVRNLKRLLYEEWKNQFSLTEEISNVFAQKQKEIADIVVTRKLDRTEKRNRKIDALLTSKKTGIPIMLLLLMVIFFITIVVSNYPSDFLFWMFSKVEVILALFLNFLHIPTFLKDLLLSGVFKTLSWVISVMLPPMAIFFPMFSLLEDLGYLPRVAFNMDGLFQKCNACGKQALTMMMGFGCNAVGVTGSRIIDSKRERLLSILTNNFVPCNGRFPMLIALISMFFVGGNLKNIQSVFLLMLLILLSCIMTFLVSYLLSKTLLKGEKSSFTLELPPFRRPEVLKVIVRSFKDKTFHILKKAILVSIPAGAFLFLLSNIHIGSCSLLLYFTNFLDPFARFIGLDGVILGAFLLGFPANEIVIPIMLMAYLQTGTMQEYSSLLELKNLFVLHGWTFETALCTSLFVLFHFPCSTTTLTIYHETKSFRWTLLSVLLPTLLGILLCFIVHQFFLISVNLT